MPSTQYGKTICGKDIAGYGIDDLKNNTRYHEENCKACLAMKNKFTETLKSSIVDNSLDLNKDGVVDAKDASLASKVLNKVKKKL